MLPASILVALILLILCFNSIRATIFIVIAVGVLQDPIRKLVPEEPVFFVVLVGIFFAAGMLGAILRNGPRYFAPLFGFNNALYYPIAVLLIILLIQAFVTIVRYDQVVLAIVGLVGYLAPLLALPLAYYYVNTLEDVKRLLAVYIGFNIFLALGIYLSFLSVDWTILKQVGEGIVIYDLGTVLQAHSGFARSPEIAGWHIAAGVCMLGTLSVTTEKTQNRLWFATLMVILIGAIVLTGRRKMLIEVVLFFFFYFSILVFTRTTGKRIFVGSLIVVLGLSVWLGLQEIFPIKYERQLDLYLQRGATVFEDAPQRFSALGLGSLYSSVQRVGWFGAGMGLGSQGARYFSDMSVTPIIGGSTEGGLGKLLVELGVPGLFVLLWLLWRINIHIYTILQYCNIVDKKVAHLGMAMSAFLATNILIFIVASQVYGDLFILLLLGMFIGILFATPKIFASRCALVGVETSHQRYLHRVP